MRGDAPAVRATPASSVANQTIASTGTELNVDSTLHCPGPTAGGVGSTPSGP